MNCERCGKPMVTCHTMVGPAGLWCPNCAREHDEHEAEVKDLRPDERTITLRVDRVEKWLSVIQDYQFSGVGDFGSECPECGARSRNWHDTHCDIGNTISELTQAIAKAKGKP